MAESGASGTGRAIGASGFGNRFAMWRAGLVRPATGFVAQPEPRTIGLYARGKQLVSGNFVIAGHVVEAPGQLIWDVPHKDSTFAEEIHGFAWLDDLAAVGDAAARARAQTWTWAWISRYGHGRGPGWSPDLTGRRLIRWINHAFLLLSGRSKAESMEYFRLLSAQTVFLSRRWSHAAPGLPRFEALTGLISAGLALTGMDRRVAPAVQALAEECGREIDAGGGIPTRSPEELLEVFTLLTWSAQALGEAGQSAPPGLTGALERVAPVLRALRHADGGLARFHGGGRGFDGRLDQALAASGVRGGPIGGLAMGFARLSGGRTSIIVDAAPPPDGRAGAAAHASTLAFELTSGRRPVIVNCGSGASFGPEWRLAGRATASHSTLEIEGFSSSRLSNDSRGTLGERAQLRANSLMSGSEGARFAATHTGWSGTHGLIHGRELDLSADGRHLTGNDSLFAETAEEQQHFGHIVRDGRPDGVGYSIRFHLHPDVDATLDMGGTAVSLALKSSEIWVFRHDGQARLTLEPSVYLEKGRLKPRAARQIVLSGRATQIATRIGWTLAKAQDTPLAIRDLDREEMPVPM